MQAISGTVKSRPRWELCVADVNQNMGMAVGRLYVQRFFDKQAKHEVRRTSVTFLNYFLSIQASIRNKIPI